MQTECTRFKTSCTFLWLRFVDAASAIVAERVTAALSVRVWCFGQTPEAACHTVLLAKGRAVLCRPGEDDRALSAPALIWLPPAARGSFRLGAGGEGYSARISAAFVQRVASDPMLAAHRQPSLKRTTIIGAELLTSRLPMLLPCFEALVEESREIKAGAGAVMGLQLGLLILQLWRWTDAQDTHGGSGDSMLQRFGRLIELHYRDHLRVSDYAERLGVSTAHLHETCLRVGGQTPLSLVHARVLEEARTALRQGAMSVEQVGYGLGFRDPGYFNRFFKRLTGESPGGFQRRNADRIKPAPATFAAWP